MSKIVMWSDLHLDHKGISKRFRPSFSSDEEHNEVLFDRLASKVTKRDVMLLAGDIAFSLEWLNRIGSIPCIKRVLILGNHDTEGRGGVEGYHHAAIFDEIHGLLKKGPFWLSHCPIHPQELRGKVNIHGHTHFYNIQKEVPRTGLREEHEVDDPRYINICPEQTDYHPVVYQDLHISLMNRRKQE